MRSRYQRVLTRRTSREVRLQYWRLGRLHPFKCFEPPTPGGRLFDGFGDEYVALDPWTWHSFNGSVEGMCANLSTGKLRHFSRLHCQRKIRAYAWGGGPL